MSNLIVEICAVEEIVPITGADRIERVRVKNWWCVASKGQYQIGDRAVYVPPDSVLPTALAERWGIAKHCSLLPKQINGERPDGLRVRAAKFLGAPSFGTLQTPDDSNWTVGTDVREHYGIVKYEPPPKICTGDIAPEDPLFHCYSSMKRFGDYPGVFADGEEVIVTEKLHGTNSRVGYVFSRTEAESSAEYWEFMAGSHDKRRKEYSDKGARSLYWIPFMTEEEYHKNEGDPLKTLMVVVLAKEGAKNSVIFFGEILGAGVQDMSYGQKGKIFRLFDISVDGNYLDAEKTVGYANSANIPMVPILYRGPFSRQKMEELVDGPTTMCKPEEILEPFKGREGIVIKPIQERFNADLGGRAILKYVSADYHARKNKNQTEDH